MRDSGRSSLASSTLYHKVKGVLPLNVSGVTAVYSCRIPLGFREGLWLHYWAKVRINSPMDPAEVTVATRAELPVSRQASFTYQNKPRLSADLRSTLVECTSRPLSLRSFGSRQLRRERFACTRVCSSAHCRSSRCVLHCSKSSPTTAAAAAAAAAAFCKTLKVWNAARLE